MSPTTLQTAMKSVIIAIISMFFATSWLHIANATGPKHWRPFGANRPLTSRGRMFKTNGQGRIVHSPKKPPRTHTVKKAQQKAAVDQALTNRGTNRHLVTGTKDAVSPEAKFQLVVVAYKHTHPELGDAGEKLGISHKVLLIETNSGMVLGVTDAPGEYATTADMTLYEPENIGEVLEPGVIPRPNTKKAIDSIKGYYHVVEKMFEATNGVDNYLATTKIFSVTLEEDRFEIDNPHRYAKVFHGWTRTTGADVPPHVKGAISDVVHKPISWDSNGQPKKLITEDADLNFGGLKKYRGQQPYQLGPYFTQTRWPAGFPL